MESKRNGTVVQKVVLNVSSRRSRRNSQKIQVDLHFQSVIICVHLWLNDFFLCGSLRFYFAPFVWNELFKLFHYF